MFVLLLFVADGSHLGDSSSPYPTFILEDWHKYHPQVLVELIIIADDDCIGRLPGIVWPVLPKNEVIIAAGWCLYVAVGHNES